MKFNFCSADINEDYDPAKHLKKFETLSEAHDRRRRLMSALPEFGEPGRALAERLNGCGFFRCRSAGCPVCLRAFRRWWGSTLAEYMARDPEFWFTASIVPADLFDVGHLDSFRWDRLKDRLRNQIARAPISEPIVLGGIDYDLKHFDDGRPPRWCPHLYLLFSGGGIAPIESTFRRHYPKSDDVKRPVVVKSQKTLREDLVSTATYTIKARFKKRRPSTDDRGNADTENDELSLHHQAELAILLHKQGFLGRMIRHGNDSAFRALKVR
ncbi:hypothetical protein IVA98_22800 [Bradyrhizobium sp. 160]|uniref:hypothetical protein n=1 Tax=unclassified Bradyrhizobium TaxID=2631580 RepID=UPI001FF7D793|nr:MULTISPECIES: hypothetical protein [unclassified Bradyrhizobium]MCK1546751.1 hypothetical protein [Bradyrhizobium sp. 179]MCK1625941.1 hypothetical protein [Bradyrhizobium sp. 160]